MCLDLSLAKLVYVAVGGDDCDIGYDSEGSHDLDCDWCDGIGHSIDFWSNSTGIVMTKRGMWMWNGGRKCCEGIL